jgi:2-dehydropantoate 2-reductase
MAEITIVGTGAMAMLFGGRLAKVGVKVHFLGKWKECIEAINQNGVCIIEDGSPRYYPAAASNDLENIQGTRTALVLVKSWQTEPAARLLSGFLSKDGVALTLQNGFGNWESLASSLGQDRVASGVTTYGATVIGPGSVRPGGDGIISIQNHPRIVDLIEMLRTADFTVEEVSDLSGLVWKKLIINVAINPLTGLFGVTNGKLLDSSAAVRIMDLAAQEAFLIATELGIKLDTEDPVQLAKEVAAATGDNISSMLQDLRRGAPTEIDALCGAVVNHGKDLGIATPVNEMLALLIKGKDDFLRERE